MPTAPVFSAVADLYWWKTTKTLTSITPGAAGSFATDQIKLDNKSFFVFCAWRGASSYDPAVQLRASIGAGPAAATGIYPAAVPSNFSVMVKRENRYSMMDRPMPQAALCSTGYRAGNQVPWPIVYPPLTQFNFTIYNTAEVQFTAANQSTAKNNRVDFGLFGYNVLAANWELFLAQWPELYGKAMDSLTSLRAPVI